MRASLRGLHRAARWSAHCVGSLTKATVLMARKCWLSSWTAAIGISPRYTMMTGCGRMGFWMQTLAVWIDDPEAEPRDARHTPCPESRMSRLIAMAVVCRGFE